MNKKSFNLLLIGNENGGIRSIRQYHQETTLTEAKIQYSPKAVAKAIGVSESSLKRWCDSGKISASKTAGGHRRLSHADIISFLHKNESSLQEPEVIDLPRAESHSISSSAAAQDLLYQHLIDGNERGSRDLFVYLFVNLWPLQKIVDEVITPAFAKIGVDWSSGKLDVYQERRGCEVCVAAMKSLRKMIPDAPETARKVIGGSISQEPFSVPTLSAEICLAGAGWNARSLDGNVPLTTYLEIAQTERPELFWLSISQVANESQLISELNQFRAAIDPSVSLVVGGSGVSESILSRLNSVVAAASMSHLIQYAETVPRRVADTVGLPPNGLGQFNAGPS
jgi:excisionase family DNA binding protein